MLSDVDNATGTVADLLTMEDVLKVIKATSIEKVTTNTIQHVSEFNINDLCVVIWLVNSKWERFLAYIKEQMSEEEYVVDDLKHLKGRSNSRSKYPVTDDTKTIHLEQLLDVKVEGDWDLTQNERSMKYLSNNVREIQKYFKMAVNKI